MTHILAMCPSTENIWRASKSIPYYVLKVAKASWDVLLIVDFLDCALMTPGHDDSLDWKWLICIDVQSDQSLLCWLGRRWCFLTCHWFLRIYVWLNHHWVAMLFPKYAVVSLEVMLWCGAHAWKGSCIWWRTSLRCALPLKTFEEQPNQFLTMFWSQKHGWLYVIYMQLSCAWIIQILRIPLSVGWDKQHVDIVDQHRLRCAWWTNI